MKAEVYPRRGRSASLAVLLWLTAVTCGATSLAAQTASLSGTVVSDSAGRGLAGAVVSLSGAASRIVETDSLGAFRFVGLPPGAYEVVATLIGHEAARARVTLAPDERARVTLRMTLQVIAIEGVNVEVERARQRFREEAGATIREIDRPSVKLIPGVAESDVLRAVEVLPGVVSTSDFTAAFNVRGGSADQNLILLDGFPVYNPFHLGGLFSVFNSDMLERAELLAGGFPARYGGRVASVLTVTSDVGGPGRDVDAGVSLLASRLAWGEGLPDPMTDMLGLESARARVSLRRSYFDQVLRPLVDFPYHLTDAQLFAEALTRDNARLTLTGYAGSDVLDFREFSSDDFPLRLLWRWGNDMIGAAYDRRVGARGQLVLRAGYSRFETDLRFPDFGDTRFDSRIGQAVLRGDVTLPLDSALVVSLGGQLDRYAYRNRAESGGTVFRQGRETAWAPAGYGQVEWRPTDTWLLEAGARVDGWAPKSVPASVELAPRVALKRFFGPDAAVKLALGRYTQHVHSLRDEELPLGIDIWIIAGERAPAVISDQAQLGVERFFGDGWHAALEGYWREFDGVVTNNFADDPNLPFDDVLPGTGRSYGADLLLEKRSGAVDGWLALSLVKATRTFPDFVAGVEPAPEVTYPPIFDRRVEADLLLRYPLPWGLDGGLRWTVGTGLPYTRPLASYDFWDYGIVSGQIGPDDRADGGGGEEGDPPIAVALGERNAERYPPYQRLDVSFRRSWSKSWGEIRGALDLVNVYNRRNVLFYFFQYDETPAVRSGVSMFPVLPTVGVEVSF